ncbi:MAG: hypothetical protein DRP81_06240 [Candidatus Omnitrophota bacterium]|nr:MAG: hypothetical protein DRP81_06240 [Candidatus Omnitrophota bacterium]
MSKLNIFAKYVGFLSTVITITAFLGLSSYSWAVQAVDWARADPDGIFVSQPTTVTVTAQIGVDPNLIPASVNLLRLDQNNRPVAILDRLYDDGTHGDSLQGDNIFTTQVVFNEANPTTINLRVSVAYKGTLRRVLSDIFTVDVIVEIDEETFQSVLDTQEEAQQKFEGLRQIYGDEQARQMTVEWLSMQDNIQDVGISEDGVTIWCEYRCGIRGDILGGPPNTWGEPGSRSAIVLAPYDSLHDEPAEYIAGKLDSDGCIDLYGGEQVKNQNVTVNLIKTIGQYGIIVLTTHGFLHRKQAAFTTGETATIQNRMLYLRDLLAGRLTITGSGRYAILPSFIRHYIHHFPNSLVYLTVCHSYDNDTLKDAFIDKGAATFFGWRGSVTFSFGDTAGQEIFDALVNDRKTTGQAYNSMTTTTDPATGATLRIAGDHNLVLPAELVTNGSFETGDFSGWTRGNLYGCDFPYYAGPSGRYEAVVTGNATDGTYSARIGKWDQVYTGGVHGPARPGDEPCGYNFIYQDVELPAGVGKTLKFSYNIQEYDTAVWSWFDVFIKDPTTGSNLATVLYHAGKPGYDYGVYWNGGWHDVTFDLTPWAGQTIRLWFGVRQDGWGDQIAVWIDNVSISCQ